MRWRRRRVIRDSSVELNYHVHDRKLRGLRAHECELLGPISIHTTVDQLVTNRVIGPTETILGYSEAQHDLVPVIDCEFRFCTFRDVTLYVPDEQLAEALTFVSSQ